MRKLLMSIGISCGVGAVVTISFIVITIVAIFMTGGDGTAPGITYFMIALIDIPVKLLGLPTDGASTIAGVFWGVVSACITFVFLMVSKTQPWNL